MRRCRHGASASSVEAILCFRRFATPAARLIFMPPYRHFTLTIDAADACLFSRAMLCFDAAIAAI